MKRFAMMLLALMLLCSAAFSEALPVESTAPAAEEINATMTFADVVEDTEIVVAGPQATKEFIEAYVREHPDIIWDAFDYDFYFEIVQYFTEKYPEAENYNTYYLSETGYDEAEMSAGYCVTFHQNLTADDPYGGYTLEEYAVMIAIAMRELEAEAVYLGYFGNPEISFLCMDKEKALRFAVQHNQNSIYCVSTEETLVNPKWDSSLNPIRGID